MKLSIKSIEAIKPSDRREEYPDHLVKGLRLIVQPTGIKSFQLRYKYFGKSKRITLGRLDRGFSLAAARERAREELIKLEGGFDPLHEKRQKIDAVVSKTNNSTIGAAMERYEAERLKNLRSGNNAKSFLKSFKTDFANLELSNFSKDMFRSMLDDIVLGGHAVKANRVHSHVKTFMNWAEEKGLIEYNHLSSVKKPTKEAPRERFLNDIEIKIFWDATQLELEPWGYLYRLMLLSGQREAEVAHMRLSEFVEGNHWHLASSRTKNKTRHDVFLPKQAMHIVERAGRIESDYVFTTTGVGPVRSFNKPTNRLRAKMNELAGYELEHWQPHDLRRTMETNLAKLKTSQSLIDRIVNHKTGAITKMNRTYNQWEYREEKTIALQKWADHVEVLVS